MKKTSSLKSIIIIVVIVAVALLAYFYFMGSGSSQSSSLLSSPSDTSGQGALVGGQVLTLLNQIQSLRIDATLFTDPGYQTLRDYSVDIPAVNVGRPNPFSPIPGVTSDQTTSGSASH